MFSIHFTDEPLEFPYEDRAVAAAPGEIVFAGKSEGFLANLAIWDKNAYTSHWRRELKSLVDGRERIALVVSYDDPKRSSNFEIWPCYREGESVHIQNHLPWYENFPPEFTMESVSDFLKDRVVTEDGKSLSEWTVSLQEIELFLRNVTPK